MEMIGDEAIEKLKNLGFTADSIGFHDEPAMKW